MKLSSSRQLCFCSKESVVVDGGGDDHDHDHDNDEHDHNALSLMIIMMIIMMIDGEPGTVLLDD